MLCTLQFKLRNELYITVQIAQCFDFAKRSFENANISIVKMLYIKIIEQKIEDHNVNFILFYIPITYLKELIYN